MPAALSEGCAARGEGGCAPQASGLGLVGVGLVAAPPDNTSALVSRELVAKGAGFVVWGVLGARAVLWATSMVICRFQAFTYLFIFSAGELWNDLNFFFVTCLGKSSSDTEGVAPGLLDNAMPEGRRKSERCLG